MPLPDFLVIGAAKCGTTSLHRYLSQHPGIYLPAYGEPSFFAHEGGSRSFTGPGDGDWTFVSHIDDYEALFREATSQQLRGEISPRYLFFEQAPRRIHSYVPHVRLLAILRQPVDRAYSHFLMNRSRGCESESDFAAAIALEQKRWAKGWGWDWCYAGAGRYHQQLLRYYELFPPEQIQVFLYEDWEQTDEFYATMFDFLGVDADFRPAMATRERIASAPRSHSVQRLLRHDGSVAAVARRVLPDSWLTRAKGRVTDMNRTGPPSLDPELRSALTHQYFDEDIDRLQDMLGRDLTAWR
jgi:hypothetical protein